VIVFISVRNPCAPSLASAFAMSSTELVTLDDADHVFGAHRSGIGDVADAHELRRPSSSLSRARSASVQVRCRSASSWSLPASAEAGGIGAACAWTFGGSSKWPRRWSYLATLTRATRPCLPLDRQAVPLDQLPDLARHRRLRDAVARRNLAIDSMTARGGATLTPVSSLIASLTGIFRPPHWKDRWVRFTGGASRPGRTQTLVIGV
jgi:hypothetical protein